MAKRISYTQKTLRELRKRGYTCAIAEKWNAFAGPHGVRIDLFGFIDIVALDRQRRITIGIQSTGPSGHAEHKRKILACDNALEWLECRNVIELWSWRKLLKKKGGKQRIWVARVEEITEEMWKGGAE